MKVLASYNIKGGVGKTTTAINFAWLSANQGQRTLLWDLDPQSAAGYCLQADGKAHGKKLLRGKSEARDIIVSTGYNNLDLLPSDSSYRNADVLLHEEKNPLKRLHQVLKPLGKEYDLIVLDCPPGLTLLSEAVFRAADALIVPTIPSILSLRTLRMLIDFRKDNKLSKLHILAFLTMVDRRKKLHNTVLESRSRLLPWVMDSYIPNLSDIEQMAERRSPLFQFAPHGRAAEAYSALWSEVSQRINNIS